MRPFIQNVRSIKHFVQNVRNINIFKAFCVQYPLHCAPLRYAVLLAVVAVGAVVVVIEVEVVMLYT